MRAHGASALSLAYQREGEGTKYYTAATIDWLAVWDAALDRCYYKPAIDLGTGMNLLTLRLSPTRNNQVQGIRPAEKYASI
jgi:hypothetical protein